jgi:signal transduction histidine kinase/DNA-binding NarL/FixJ family response regulator/HPt (histidine-containing phosphotransfer) domain-containing protein
MIRQSIEGILSRRFDFEYLYERYSWRRAAAATFTATLLCLTLTRLPLSLGVEQQLLFAPAALLLLAMFCGLIPVLMSVALIAGVQTLLHGAEFNPWMQGLSAAVAATLLLRTRLPIFMTMMAYGAINLLPLLASAFMNSSFRPEAWSAELFASIVNFCVAIAAWTLLPRKSYTSRRHQRRSLMQIAFSWSMAAALVPALIVLAGAHIHGSADHFAIVNPYVMLLGGCVAVAICTALAHVVTSSINYVAADARVAAYKIRGRRSLHDSPPELAGFALHWHRRLQYLQRVGRKSDSEMAELRANNERLRSSMVSVTKRLQDQSQTLLQSQQRDTLNVKNLENALRQANATIEKIRNSQILFIATMSHEVRTPLHGLMSTLSLLREESLSSEGVRRLGIARTSARSLLQIANDILDLSRIEAGGFSLEFAAFSPRGLVREIVEEFQASAQSQRLALIHEVGDDVPGALLGDRARIRQIISNLVTNALKFTPSGSITIRVAWRGGKLVADVVDTGEGVPADKRKVIFDAFVQIESATNRRFAGTGLGLTIGRHLAEAMGGALTLHSTGEEGSTFRLELSLQVSGDPLPEDQSARVLVRYAAHVLVVEDNDANQYVARVLLESLGCTVTIASSGMRALQLVQEVQFDLVFMDFQLPGMDGVETCKRMRKVLHRRIPIIAMTANALPETKTKSIDAGMDDFLSKPFTKSTLSRALSQWLAHDGAVETAEDIAQAGRTEPILDPSVFEELWESLRWRTKPLQEIYDAVIDNVRNMIQLLDALDKTPMQKILRSLHTVRGSASMVGAKRLTRIAAMLEHAASNQQLDRKAVEEAQLPKALRDLETELDQRLSSYTNARPA